LYGRDLRLTRLNLSLSEQGSIARERLSGRGSERARRRRGSRGRSSRSR
jgi:hypothetical protein